MMSGKLQRRKFPDWMIIPANKMKFEETIGSGAFGSVCRAEHKEWGSVAVKRLPQQFINEKDKCVTRMIREVEILIELRHPNIIAIRGVIFEEKTYGIILEYLKYNHISQFFDDFDVPLAWKIRLSHDVVLGMNYLHARSNPIIHGDLKAPNVLVADGYQAKISDFGLSSWRSMSRSSSRQLNQGIQGTVTHIPPEQWSDVNLMPTEKGDVYAFGILLWEMFTEDVPFQHICPSAISPSVVAGQRPDMKKLPKDLPLLMREMMEKSWASDPNARPSFCETKRSLDCYIEKEERNISNAKERIQPKDFSSLQVDGARPATINKQEALTNTNVNLPICVDDAGTHSAPNFGSTEHVFLKNNKVDTSGFNENVVAKKLDDEPKRDENRRATSDAVIASLMTSCPSINSTRQQRPFSNNSATFLAIQETSNRSLNQESGVSQSDENISLCTFRSVDPERRAEGRTEGRAEGRTGIREVEGASGDEATRQNITRLKVVDEYGASAGFGSSGVSGKDVISLREDGRSGIGIGDQRTKNSSLDLPLMSSPATLISEGASRPSAAATYSNRLNQDQPASQPEVDAIVTPESRQPNLGSIQLLSPTQNPLSQSTSENNISAHASVAAAAAVTNYDDLNHGYFPKDGQKFQKHGAPLPVQASVLPATTYTQPVEETERQPKIDLSQPHVAYPDPTGIPFACRKETAHNGPTEAANSAGVQWNKTGDCPKYVHIEQNQNQPAFTIRNGNKEMTVFDLSRLGSCVQIGDNNTMYVTSGRPSGGPGGRRGGSGFHQSSSGSAGHAMSTGKQKPASNVKRIIVPDKIVDFGTIRLVSDNIGKEWKHLGRRLGLRDSDIDAFEIDHRALGVREMAYQMLRDWREKEGTGAKIDVLASALVAVKRPDVAQQLSTRPQQ